jgi:hypothetical protein
MSGFTKLVPEIVQSSIWNEPSDIRIVWITMLAIKDENGYVRGNAETLARMANVPIDAVNNALTKFQNPDANSHTPDDDGRRIEKYQGGWLVLNHDKYRCNDSVVREQARLRVKKHRDRRNISDKNVDVTPCNVTVTPCNVTVTPCNVTENPCNVTETLHSASASASASSSSSGGCGGDSVSTTVDNCRQLSTTVDKLSTRCRHSASASASDSSSSSLGGYGGREGATDIWSLDEVIQIAASPSVSVTEAMAMACYDHYASQGWCNAAGNPVGRSRGELGALLRKWKTNQPSHGSKYVDAPADETFEQKKIRVEKMIRGIK